MGMQKYTGVLQDTAGNIIANQNARVRVTITQFGGLASLFADDETTPLGNPINTDADGQFTFKVQDGEFTIQDVVTSETITEIQQIFLPPSGNRTGDIGDIGKAVVVVDDGGGLNGGYGKTAAPLADLAFLDQVDTDQIVDGAVTAIKLAADTRQVILLETINASGASTIDFETSIDSTYKKYRVDLINVVPNTDNEQFFMRVGTGATPTYDSGPNYSYGGSRVDSSGVEALFGNDTVASLSISGLDNIGGSGIEQAAYTVEIFNPADATYGTMVTWTGSQIDNFAVVSSVRGGGVYEPATAVTAFRFRFSNNVTAIAKLYGIL